MSQRIKQTGMEVLPLPDFHDDGDLFEDNSPLSAAHPRRRRVLIILSIVLLVLLITGGVLIARPHTHIVYLTQRVMQDDLVLSIKARGALHTNAYTVNFMGSGKLAAIPVSVGQTVKKDQILARLDPASLQNAFNEAQADFQAAQTTLDNANANYEAIQAAAQSHIASAQATATTSVHTNSVHTNAEKGASGTASPQTQVAQPSTTVGADSVQEIEALGQIKAAQKALAWAQTKLDTAKYNLNNALLKAPHAGIIASLNGIVGGEPGATFIQIVDPSSLQLQANVNESDIGAVAVGDAVSFSVDAYQKQSFDGNVVAILPLGQSLSNSVTYPVLINMVSSISNPVHLLPGMTAQATITVNQRTGVVVLPVSAVTFAQAAVEPRAETNNQSLITSSQMQAALARAKVMLQNEQQDLSQEKPFPAAVLERSGYAKISVIPIVLGLTNGTDYEVLDGLSANAVVLIGARTSDK